MAQDNPYEKYRQPAQGGIYTLPQSAEKQAAERRAEEDQAMQRDSAARDAARLGVTQQGQALQAQGQQFQQGNQRYDNLAALRNSFNGLQAVKDYKAVLPLLMSGLQTAPNAQGDNALIYAYAKVMDPGSVVRESEGEMAANTAGFWDAKAEQLKKSLGWDGARGLPPKAAQGLRVEMNRKVAGLAKAYGSERLNAQEFARQNGFEPDQVVGRSPAEPFMERYAKLVPEASQNALNDAPNRGTPTLDPNAPSSTEEDKRVAAAINAARRGGASYEELNALHQQLRGVPLGEQYRQYLDQGGNQDFPAAQSSVAGQAQQLITGAAETPLGGAALAYGNAALGGVPTLLAGQDNLQAMRDANPWATMGGEIAGGVTGALGAGKILGGASRLAAASPEISSILANPITADAAYGATFGGTTSEDPLVGALVGAGLGAGGGYLGSRVSQAGGQRAATNAALDAVPTTDQVRQTAGNLYTQAASNPPATPMQTQDLSTRIASLLAGEGRISPAGRVSEVHPTVKEAYQLTQDYAKQPMQQQQLQAVRSVLGEGRMSAEPAEARISNLLTNEFDNWAAPISPELSSAREQASRYLTAEQLEQARQLAEADASRMSASGFENALRQQYRNLDKAAIKGREMFDPAVLDAIETVSRGTPMSNTMRNVGKLAPTGPVSLMAGGGAPFAIGTAIGGPALGAGASLATMGIGALARKAATGMADRQATIAEILARNGGEVQVPQVSPELIDALIAGGVIAPAAPGITDRIR